jgi:pentalenic acid synthase
MPDSTTEQPAPVTFPQDRTCPYHPPTGYAPLIEDDRPLSRVTLFDGREAWVVTGRDTARELLVDRRLSSDRLNPDFPHINPAFAGIPNPRRTALLDYDEPEHTTQRRMLIPSFTVKRINTLRSHIQKIVDRSLNEMARKGSSAELVSAFALPVTSRVICVILGVPYADHNFFEEQSRRLMRSTRGADTDAARKRLNEYLGQLVDAKRENPGDGLLDDLIREQLDEGDLDRGLLIELATVLLAAGHENTANMISTSAFTLLQHPKQLAELRADPSLMPAAVEELLRFLSVVDRVLRVATEDIEVGDTTIRAGEGVVFSPSMINRDEAAFEQANVLEWHRPVRHHVAFGFGAHQCIAQNLARAEVEIALRSLFDRFPDLRLAAPAEQIPINPGVVGQGMVELPVAW